MKSSIKTFAFWLLLLLGGGLSVLSARAQTQLFPLGETSVRLQEVTANVGVYFYSMRLDRGANVWNLEVSITNTSSRPLSGPIVLMVDSFSGTSGMRQPDGLTSDTPGKAFYDLSLLTPAEGLAAGQGSARRTLIMGVSTGSPKLVTRVFAGRSDFPPLGLSRSLNGVGQPLTDIEVVIDGPSGSVIQKSDPFSGVISFGQESGVYQLRFNAPDHLSVWRQVTLPAQGVALVPNPRLTHRSGDSVELTPLGGLVLTNRQDDIRFDLPSGAVSESTTLRVTSLTGQSLPGFLPLGWSPVQAFWLESSKPLTASLSVRLRPWSSTIARMSPGSRAGRIPQPPGLRFQRSQAWARTPPPQSFRVRASTLG